MDASPTIQSNDIVSNLVASSFARGAGIHIEGGVLGGTITIDDNLIALGTGYSHSQGGPSCVTILDVGGPINGTGIYVENSSDVAITNNRIEDNAPSGVGVMPGSNHKGGGIYCNNSSPLIEGNLFTGNVTALGSGIFNANNSNPQIVDCEFRHNGWVGLSHAGRGGGAMYNENSAPTVINCKFLDNATRLLGGGAVINSLSDSQMQPTFVNCLFANNDSVTAGAGWGGGAMKNSGGAPLLVNCTFSGNTTDFRGGALWNILETQVTLDNCILWGDSAPTPDDGDEIYIETSATVTVNWSDPEGGEPAVKGPGTLVWGAGNIGEDPVEHDPAFINPGFGNYRFLTGSPVIDAANNLAVPAGITTDLDGNERFLDDPNTDPTGVPFPGGDADIIVDMGAYEFNTCGLCPTDFNGNGVTGPIDLAQLLGCWGPITPESVCTCLDADGNGNIGPLDLATLLGAWGSCCGDGQCLADEGCGGFAECLVDCDPCP